MGIPGLSRRGKLRISNGTGVGIDPSPGFLILSCTISAPTYPNRNEKPFLSG
jgi:hypothetical protein